PPSTFKGVRIFFALEFVMYDLMIFSASCLYMTSVWSVFHFIVLDLFIIMCEVLPCPDSTLSFAFRLKRFLTYLLVFIFGISNSLKELTKNMTEAAVFTPDHD